MFDLRDWLEMVGTFIGFIILVPLVIIIAMGFTG